MGHFTPRGASCLALALAAAPAAAQVPLPEPHPERAVAAPAETFGEALAVLFGEEVAPTRGVTSPDYLIGVAYDRLQNGQINAALQIARAIPDDAGRLLIEWLIATEGYAAASAARMAEAAAAVAGWPGRALMQIRYEQAVRREAPTAAAVVAIFDGQMPVLEPTILLLARSYLAANREDDAAALIRGVWRDQSFSREMEDTILAEFGGVLTPDDHHWRMSRLLYDGATEAATRVAGLMGSEMQALAAAWTAATLGRSNAASLLAAVPAALRSDPGYQYARVLQLLTAGQYTNAAQVILAAPTDPVALVDPEAWAMQRRDIARFLAQRGNPALAYQLAAGHSAQNRDDIAATEFVAGWIALTHLRDAAGAIAHFERLGASSSLPLSQSRAHYWLGRSYDALRDDTEAERHYTLAAAYHTTYYGQLALEQLGAETLPVAPEPVLDEAVRERFLANDVAQAMIWLDALGRAGEAEILARSLGDTLANADEVALLTRLAEIRGDHQLALQIAKLAANRGLAVDAAAFSTAILPGGMQNLAELALVFAVARQESNFDIAALSGAGAIGLLQVQPATGREMARYVGLPFAEARLSTDPVYNAILGGAYLRTLLDRYRGSVVLALAAFNAGPTRADRWIELYGDPRNANVDTINWIETIPFDETRNYVQRVLENLQVYRARLGDPELRLAEDLRL